MKIETVIATLNSKSLDIDDEIIIHDYDNSDNMVVVENITSHKFGLIACDVVDYPDEPLCLFTFNGKLYEYCKMEGFSQKDMTDKDGFAGKVLKKVTLKEFFNYILNN